MLFELSLGEAIDKLNILELKLKKIKNPEKLHEVQKEIDALSSLYEYKKEDYYNFLSYVNEQIWILTDKIKETTDKEINILAKNIFALNEKRFRIKKIFNTFSNLKEQKSYNATFCKITVPDNFLEKIHEINYLSLDYDYIIFDKDLRNIFHTSNFIHIDKSVSYSKTMFNWEFYVSFYPDLRDAGIVTEEPARSHWENHGKNEGRFCNIKITKFEEPCYYDVINGLNNVLSPEIRHLFDFIPIKYRSGGKLGDLVHNLSVINENYLKTGRKGQLFIQQGDGDDYDVGDSFRTGIENTYNDTYEVIHSQKYIQCYKIFEEQTDCVNLNQWRANLLDTVWYNIYKHYYNIEWGTHKWLDVPNEPKWNETILINTTEYYFPHQIDFQELYNVHSNKLLFVAMDPEQYKYFIKHTGLYIKFHKIENFTEMCILINSCKCIYGSFSAPLSIAGALHKQRFPALYKIHE